MDSIDALFAKEAEERAEAGSSDQSTKKSASACHHHHGGGVCLGDLDNVLQHIRQHAVDDILETGWGETGWDDNEHGDNKNDFVGPLQSVLKNVSRNHHHNNNKPRLGPDEDTTTNNDESRAVSFVGDDSDPSSTSCKLDETKCVLYRVRDETGKDVKIVYGPQLSSSCKTAKTLYRHQKTSSSSSDSTTHGVSAETPSDMENGNVTKQQNNDLSGDVIRKEEEEEEEHKHLQEHDADSSDPNQGHQHLLRVSLKTAIAISLHNFPEGLATFAAALHDPRVGIMLAVATAIHNIPEGLCVALPIYYATKSKWKAFMAAFLSGASELFAALLGWLVLANSLSDTTYGIMFGGVAGMMVIISMREMIPTAIRYDPKDKVVTTWFCGGMIAMAVSLVLVGF